MRDKCAVCFSFLFNILECILVGSHADLEVETEKSMRLV